MRSLLDVNVLVALVDPQSATHAAANSFLAANLADGWASCPLTENACLRLLTNPRYHAPAQPSIVLGRLEETKQAGNHAFWPDDVSITDAAIFDWDRLQGHQQITDVYLLALAVAHGGRLVTFDQRIRREAVRGCGAYNLLTL
jgi:toxin-antitoxin system PIN domain toxin